MIRSATGAARPAPARRTASTVRIGVAPRPAASCTRTPQAPAWAASTVVASVASSRCSAGRGAPSASASSRPRKVLREAPTSTGSPSPTSRSRPASSAQLCSAFLANPRPGVEHQLLRGDPGGDASSTRAISSRADLGDDVAVPRRGVHLAAVPAPVHQHPGHAGLGDQLGHVRVGQPAADVVDEHGAGRERRLGDRGPGGVDAGAHAGGGQLADHREHPAALLLGVDPVGAGPGRLAADVDESAPAACICQAVRDRGGRGRRSSRRRRTSRA